MLIDSDTKVAILIDYTYMKLNFTPICVLFQICDVCRLLSLCIYISFVYIHIYMYILYERDN